MALQLVKPGDLPVATSVDTDAALVVQNGEAVEQATPAQIVTAGRPIASEIEAVTGTDNTKAMTPLTVRQAIDADTSGAVIQAQEAADAAASSALDAESAEEQTGLDALATAADRVQTGLDATATAADRIQTGLDAAATGADATATAADRVQTGLDAAATAADAVATAADRVQTGLDAAATAADRVQTGIDRAATEAAASSTGLMGRNLIINGSGQINQRGYVSGAATSGANQFTLDRWFVITSGQNLAFTGGNSGRVMTAPAGGVSQVIEGANIVGGTYVLNWTGTASATVGGVARAKGETFTLTADTNVTITFSSGTFSEVQLERGSVVTPFEWRPIGHELTLCKRYYQSVMAGLRLYAGAANNFNTNINWPEMRAAPTITLAGSIVSLNATVENLSDTTSFSTRWGFQSVGVGDSFILERVLRLSAELTS